MQISGSLFICDNEKPLCSRSSHGLHMVRWGGVSIHGTTSQLCDLYAEIGRHMRVTYAATLPSNRDCQCDECGDMLESSLAEHFAPYRET